MKYLSRIVLLSLWVVSFWAWQACKPDTDTPNPPDNNQNNNLNTTNKVASGFPETFESTTKGDYTTATLNLPSGSWTFNNALIGVLPQDKKVDLRAARIRGNGSLTMQFDISAGVSSVTVMHAAFSNDANSTWELWASTNSGDTWNKIGNTITTTATLQTANFWVNIQNPIRFEIRKTSGDDNVRINFDNITINEYNGLDDVATRDNPLVLGNPSNAITDVNNCTNYLMVRPQYALAYNCSTSTPNWVAWHLSNAWKGNAPRQDNFRADTSLPAGWYRVKATDYQNSGFDRGHLCPSEDRDASIEDNSATFLMTNMMPQAPSNNRGTWGTLEEYCRKLLTSGNELYIYAGPHGTGGSGSNGGLTTTLADGKIRVPNVTWKVIVVLPSGSNDLSRVTNSTRVIAVRMPNAQSINSDWGSYRVSVRTLEQLTGFNFLSSVPMAIQNVIETQVDTGPTK